MKKCLYRPLLCLLLSICSYIPMLGQAPDFLCMANVASVTTSLGPSAVAVSGQYAYVVAIDDSLRVYDISNPNIPLEVASIYAGKTLGHMAIAGNYAYLTDGNDGGGGILRNFDISNPLMPFMVDSISTGPCPEAITISGNSLFVTDYCSDNKLRIYDIGNPLNLSQLGFATTGPMVTCVAVAGNLAVTGDIDNGELLIFDITSLNSPTLLSTVSFAGFSPRDIKIYGSTVYVLDANNSGSLKVYDLTNPLIPVLLGSVATGSVPNSLSIDGSIAVVADVMGNDVRAYYIGNPANPTQIGVVSTGVGATPFTGSGPFRLTVSGNHAYVVDINYSKLLVIQLDCIAPVANNDIASTNKNTSVDIPVLVNDTFADLIADSSSVDLDTLVAGLQHIISTIEGEWKANDLGLVTFLPSLNFEGTSVIYYQVKNIGGAISNAATITVRVNPDFSCIHTSSITATGTAPRSVAIDGNYAYVVDATSNDLRIYDVSDQTNPVQVGIVATGTTPHAVVVAGGYAYVVDGGSNDLRIFDVSTVTNPVQVGVIATGSSPFSLTVAGNYAYVVDNSSHLTLFDISTPASPAQIGQASTGLHPHDVAVSGSVAYTIDFTSMANQLLAFDISNPASPVVIGSALAGDHPVDMEISGNYAYVVNNVGNTLNVFDISNPTTPTQVGSVATGIWPNAISIAGTYAFVVDGFDNDLRVIDVSDPSSPTYVTAIATGTNPFSVEVFGNYAYVVDMSSNDLRIIQLSCIAPIANQDSVTTNENVPVTIHVTVNDTDADDAIDVSSVDLDSSTHGIQNSYSTTSGTWTSNLSGDVTFTPALNFLGVASISYTVKDNSGAISNIATIYVSVTSTFTCLSTVDSVNTGNQPSYVTLSANQAYVVNWMSNDLMIYDLSNPAHPVLTGTVATGNNPYGVAVSGDYAYVVDWSDHDLRIYDVSNPSNPTQLSSIATGNNPPSVAVQGNYVYVVSEYSNDLRIYDVSNPSAPLQLSSIPTATIPTFVTVSGNYAYVTNDGLLLDYLIVYDVSNPTAPFKTDSILTGNYPQSVSISGNYAFVNDLIGHDMRIFDISNPNNLVQVSTIAAGSFPASLAVNGNYAYIVDATTRLMTVYDISTPSNPLAVASNPTGLNPISIFVAGNYAYEVNYNGDDLHVIHLACLPPVAVNDTVNISINSIATIPVTVNDTADNGSIDVTTVDLDPSLSGIQTTTTTGDGAWSVNNSGVVSFTPDWNFNGIAQLNYTVKDNAGATSNQATIFVNMAVDFSCLNTISTTAVGGTPYMSAISGNYAYVVNYLTNDLRVYDISNANSPNQVGSLYTGVGSHPISISIAGNYAYLVTNGSNDIRVVDISNPSNPTQVGSVSATNPYHIEVIGHYAYVVDFSNNLILYDVSTPSNPTQVSSIATGNAPYSFAISGTHAFVVDQLSNDLRVYDISTPVSLTQIGVVSTGLATNPIDIAISGNYALEINYTTSDLRIFDISAPTNPIHIGTVATGTNPISIAVSGHYAFVVGYSDDLRVFNFSNPSAPILIDSISAGNNPIGITIVGNFAYIVDLNNELRIIQLSCSAPVTVNDTLYTNQGIPVSYSITTNDSDTDGSIDVTTVDLNPSLAGIQTSVSTSEGTWSVNNSGQMTFAPVWSMDTSASIAYTVKDNEGHVSNTATIFVHITLDFSCMTTVGIAATGSAPWSLDVSGGHAFVVDQTSGDLRIYDINTPANPSQISTISTYSSPTRVLVSGNYVYTLEGNGNVLGIYNISTPASPVQVSATTINGIIPYGAYALDISGHYVYEVDFQNDEMNVIDIINPANPTIVATTPTRHHPCWVTVSGNNAYVLDRGNSDMLVYDISNPLSPVQVGSVTTGGAPYEVKIKGHYAYVVGFSSDLRIFDISTPSNPVQTGLVATGSWSKSISVVGNYAYVVNASSNDLRAYSIADPTSPVQVAVISTGVNPFSIKVVGNYAFLVDRSSNDLRVIRLTCEVPTPEIVSYPGNQYCFGETVELEATGVLGATFNWNIPAGCNATIDNSVSGESTLNISSLDATCNGYFSVSQTLPGSPSSALDSVFIQGSEKPVINFITTACISNTGEVTVNASGSSTLEYSINGSVYQNSNVLITAPGSTFIVGVKPTTSTCAAYYTGLFVFCPAGGTCTSIPTDSIVVPTESCSSAMSLTGYFSQASIGTWTSSGSGLFSATSCFSSPCTVTYTPSANDMLNGHVVITFSTDDPDGIGPCNAAICSKNIILYNGTIAPTLSSNSPICAGSTLQITSNHVPGTITWSGPNLYTATGDSVIRTSATVNMTGIYTATTSIPGCISSSTSVVVQVLAAPSLLVSVMGHAEICAGNGNGSIDVSVSGGSGVYTMCNAASCVSGNTAHFSYIAPGNYTITVTDVACPNNTLSYPVSIAAAPMIPIPIIAPTITSCVGDNLVLSGSVTLPATTILWVNGATNLSAIGNPIVIQNVTLAMNGTYFAKALNAAGCASATIPFIVEVYAKPVISNVQVNCFGITAHVTVTATVGSGTLFYSLDGTVYQSSNVFTNVVGGNYTLYVRTNMSQCITTLPISVLNCACPTAPVVTITSPPVSCGSTPIPLSATFTNVGNATWSSTGTGMFSVNNGASPLVTVYTPSIGDIMLGHVNISLTTDDPDGLGPCTAVSSTVSISLVDTLLQPIISTNQSNYCSGDTVILGASPLNGSVVWNGVGGYTTNNDSAILINSTSFQSGQYTVTASGNGCVSKSASILLIISAPPVLNVTTHPLPEGCEGHGNGSIHVEATGGSGAYNICNITNPTCFTGTTSADFKWLAPAIYTIQVADVSCPNYWNSTAVSVGAGAHVSKPDSIINNVACEGNTLSLTVYNPQPGSYLWTATNSSYTDTGVTIVRTPADLTMAGIYKIQRVVSGCASDPLYVEVHVYGIPTVTGLDTSCTGNIEAGGIITVHSSVNGGSSMEYSLNGGAYQVSPIFEHLTNGLYQVRSRVIGSLCESEVLTTDLYCACICGKEQTIELFPNPNDGNFILNSVLIKESDHITITVCDISGKVIYQKLIDTKTSILKEPIDISSYATGTYLIKVNIDEEKYLLPVVIR